MSSALDFLAFIGPCTALMILQRTFCGFIFAEILARRPLSASFSPCILIYRMISCTQAFVKSTGPQKIGRIGPLETVFRPNLACTLLVQFWQPFTMLCLPS